MHTQTRTCYKFKMLPREKIFRDTTNFFCHEGTCNFIWLHGRQLRRNLKERDYLTRLFLDYMGWRFQGRKERRGNDGSRSSSLFVQEISFTLDSLLYFLDERSREDFSFLPHGEYSQETFFGSVVISTRKKMRKDRMLKMAYLWTCNMHDAMILENSLMNSPPFFRLPCIISFAK